MGPNPSPRPPPEAERGSKADASSPSPLRGGGQGGRGLLRQTCSPWEDRPMAKCEVCGNDYDKSFTVTMGGASHTFDSFECAIHALAPECAHCGCKIMGHG